MSRPIPLLTLLPLACCAALVVATPAQADPRALDDADLSRVHGPVRPPAAPAVSKAMAPKTAVRAVNPLLGLLPPSDLHTTTVDATQFDATMDARGLPVTAPGLVTQIDISGPPVDASFDAGALFSNFGVDYHGMPLGAVQVNGLNATGTSVWVVHH